MFIVGCSENGRGGKAAEGFYSRAEWGSRKTRIMSGRREVKTRIMPGRGEVPYDCVATSYPVHIKKIQLDRFQFVPPLSESEADGATFDAIPTM